MRLGKKVEAMISQLDGTLSHLEDYVAGGSQDLANVQRDGSVNSPSSSPSLLHI